MGQKHGRATFYPSIQPFLNLSHPAMQSLWNAFHYVVSDTFALTLADVQEICSELVHTQHGHYCNNNNDDDDIRHRRLQMDNHVRALFTTLDTDKNDLIDSFEFFASLSITSAMSIREKLEFVFRMFDFNNVKALTLDELTLALRSVVFGVCKMEWMDYGMYGVGEDDLYVCQALPLKQEEKNASLTRTTTRVLRDEHFEIHSTFIFQKFGACLENGKVSIDDIVKYCVKNSECRGWMEYYGNAPESWKMIGVQDEEEEEEEHGTKEKKTTQNHDSSVSADDDDDDDDDDASIDERTLAKPVKIFDSIHEEDNDINHYEKKSGDDDNDDKPSSTQNNNNNNNNNMPWMKIKDSLTPSKYVDQRKTNISTSPKSQLELEWIYGYEASSFSSLLSKTTTTTAAAAAAETTTMDTNARTTTIAYENNTVGCKNNVRYTANGDICYHAAMAGIVCDKNEHTQRFHLEHTGKILSFALHPGGTLVATGELCDEKSDERVEKRNTDKKKERVRSSYASFPKIVIWDVNTMQSTRIIRGFHTGGIEHLAFDSSGKLLASIGQHPDACLSIYDWRESKRLFSSYTSHRMTHDLSFGRGDTVVSCGKNHVYFWTKEGGYYTKRKGIFGCQENVQTQLCIARCRDKMISGTENGYIYVWAGRSCAKTVKAHNGSVDAIHVSDRAIVSGGSDRKVQMWTLSLLKGAVFDLGVFGYAPAVTSVCLSRDASRVLVGTEGGIHEISAADGSDVNNGPIVACHFNREVYGLAVHPLKEQFCTVGEDGTIRIWNILTRNVIKMARLGAPGRCVAYAPSGEFIVVGFGGEQNTNNFSNKPNKQGGFVVLHASDLSTIHEARDSKQSITDAKFSLDGQMLVLGSADRTIYLYDVMDNYGIYGMVKTSAPIKNLDISEDGSWIQAACSGGSLTFVSVDDLSVEENISALRDVTWCTQTCPFGWATSGVWSSSKVDYGVSCCDRSEGETALVVGDEASVRLLQYPCYADSSRSNNYFGHCSRVQNIRFANGDGHVISVGGGCIFQWRHFDDDESDNEDDQLESQSGCKNNLTCETSLLTGDSHTNSLEAADYNYQASGSMLEMSFIHGLNSWDCRSNLKYSSASHLVYSTANSGVIFKKSSREQLHNMEQHGPCTCLAISLCRRFVATGSSGLRSTIVVWDSLSAKTISVLKTNNTCQVFCLSFSDDGSVLVSAERTTAGNKVVAYKWKDSFQMCASYAGSQYIHGIKVFPSLNSKNGTPSKFVQVGYKHIKFWEMCGRNMMFKKATIGRKGKLQQHFYSVDFVRKSGRYYTVVGTGNGHLYIFNDETLSTTVKAHESSVNSIFVTQSGRLASGGDDGLVKVWEWKDRYMKCILKFNLKHSPGTRFCNKIWSIDVSDDDSKILVGTKGNEIQEFAVKDDNIIHENSINCGHSESFVCNLATHPSKNEYATASFDGTIRFWDIENSSQVRFISLDSPCQVVCYSNDGQYIGVGIGQKDGERKNRAGTFLIFKEDDLVKLHGARDSKTPVLDMKFSPDDSILAVSVGESCLCLYNVNNGYTKHAIISIPENKWITNIDFSIDSQYIRMSDNFGGGVFAEVTNGCLILSEHTMKKVKWSSHDTPCGWQVSGIKKYFSKPDDLVLVCSASHQRNKFIAIDSCGIISLCEYPCPEESKCFPRKYCGHHLKGICAAWSHDDSYVITVGGGSVIQWKCLPKSSVGTGTSNERKRTGASSIVNASDNSPALTNGKENCGVIQPESMPWLEEMLPPSKLEDDISKPSYKVTLDYVHACQSNNLKLPIKCNAQGGLLYTASSAAMITDNLGKRQQFHLNHRNEITFLAITSDGRIAATGEKDNPGRVSVWDALTGMSLFSTKSNGCKLLAFSDDRMFLATVEGGENNIVTIYKSLNGEWTDAFKVASGVSHVGSPLFAIFVGEFNFPLMLGGGDMYTFLKLEGQSLNHNPLEPREYDDINSLSCGICIYLSNKPSVFTGTHNGQLIYWKHTPDTKHMKPHKSLEAHDGEVTSLVKDDIGFISGGKDCMVHIWDVSMVKLRTFRVFDIVGVKPSVSSISSICYNHLLTNILVKMNGGEIYEISKDSNNGILVAEMHNSCELHGLAMHPVESTVYATCGDDAVIRIWDIKKHKVLKRKKLEYESRAICWSPDGKFLCVGLGSSSGDMSRDGSFLVIDASSLNIVFEDRKSKKMISDIKYDSTNKSIAMSSGDGHIYLHDAKTYKMKLKTEEVSSPITALDFSLDGQYLRACTADFQLVMFTVDDGNKANLTDTPEIDWSTYTCPFGWDVQGLWNFRQRSDNGILTATDVISEKKIITFGLAGGLVGLGNFPVQSEDATVLASDMHSSPVSKIQFNKNGDYIVALGLSSRAIMQFQLFPQSSLGSRLLIK